MSMYVNTVHETLACTHIPSQVEVLEFSPTVFIDAALGRAGLLGFRDALDGSYRYQTYKACAEHASNREYHPPATLIVRLDEILRNTEQGHTKSPMWSYTTGGLLRSFHAL